MTLVGIAEIFSGSVGIAADGLPGGVLRADVYVVMLLLGAMLLLWGHCLPRLSPRAQWAGRMKNLQMKSARVAKDLSQQQLADIVGVSRQTISSIERGDYNPHNQALPRHLQGPRPDARRALLRGLAVVCHDVVDTDDA